MAVLLGLLQVRWVFAPLPLQQRGKQVVQVEAVERVLVDWVSQVERLVSAQLLKLGQEEQAELQLPPTSHPTHWQSPLPFQPPHV